MSYEVIALRPFERDLKRLLKKHPSLKKDIAALGAELEQDPFMGKPLGRDCYKVRVAITSKGRGKSGGGRVIPTCMCRATPCIYCRSTTRRRKIPSRTRSWTSC